MKKTNKHILITIPHGGYTVPRELEEYTVLDKYDLFLEADSGAREIFFFHAPEFLCIDSPVSKLFVDLDCPYTALKNTSHSVIKKKTSRDRDIFLPDHFPDDIALTNILKRHYFPFHEKIEKNLENEKIKLIIDCHTMSPVAPDTGEPRPLFAVQNRFTSGEETLLSAPDEVAENFLELLKKKFSRERGTVTTPFSLNHPCAESHIMKTYCEKGIPLLRLTLSKTLFLNERHFSFDYLKMDEDRLQSIQENLLSCVRSLVRRLPGA